MPKIYDTKAAIEIATARATLAELRDDPRSLIRRAKLDRGNAALAREIGLSLQTSLAERLLAQEEGEEAPDGGMRIVRGDGECQPGMRVRETEDRVELWCYDIIDDEFGISDEQYTDVIGIADGRPITQYINSPGGFVNEARAIHTQMARYAREVRGCMSVVDAMAASAATTIALALPRVEMARGTEFMIHRCWGVVAFNANDADAFKADFERTDRAIAGDYARKTGMSLDKVLQLMSDETYLAEDDAIFMGFADQVHGEEPPGDDGEGEQNSGGGNPAAADDGKARRARRLRLARALAGS